MLTIDKESLEIRISEILTFDTDVQPAFVHFKEGIKEELDAGEFIGEEEDKVRKFLSYTLVHEDKAQILELIAEDYEFETGHSDCEVSLFDADGIEHSIRQWVEGKFEFSLWHRP